uniref:Uncharacterized protein n=1 Tax=Oryza nivara TaxID=4536 RepID=A0A0E0FM64_ORYNI
MGNFARGTRYYRSRTPSCHTPAPPNIASSPSPPRRPPSHSPLLHCLLHTASALSSSSPTAVASSSSPSPAIARHCLADLLSQRHHQSRGGHHPRVPFAGSTVVVRSADGVNSATVVQLSIPNTCRAVLSTAAASSSFPPPPRCCASLTCHRCRRRVRLPITHASSFASPISSLRAAINLATATVAAMQPSSSDPPPLPQRRLCRPVRQHLRTLRRLIFLRATQTSDRGRGAGPHELLNIDDQHVSISIQDVGRGDFVLLFSIDWSLVDVSNFIYSVSTT